MIPIPAELLPLILGYLTNDMFTLKQCATVSHKFNFFTRAALFYRIKVRSEAEVCSLTETIRRHPDIGDVVREIRVVVSSGTTSELTSFATHLPGLLPKLRSIDLSELSRATWTFGQLGHYFSGFKSVNELLFFGSSFALPFVLASALPSLNHLSIRYHGASLRDPPPNMPPAPPALHLSSFSFHGSPSSSADSAFSWILSTDSRHTLRAVKLFVPLPRAETYGSFIRELGSELEHLDLMFPPSVNMTGEYLQFVFFLRVDLIIP